MPLVSLIVFTELLGEKLGNFVNVLVLAHIVAFAFWVLKTFQEQQKTTARKLKKQH